MWRLIYIFILMCLLGLFFKMYSLPGKFFFTMGSGGLSIIFIIKFIYTIFSKDSSHTFKLMISSICVTLSICYFLLMCKYQWWYVSFIFNYVGIIFYIILSVIIVIENKILFSEINIKFNFYKLLPAWIVVFILGIIPILMTSHQFYSIFHSKSIQHQI